MHVIRPLGREERLSEVTAMRNIIKLMTDSKQQGARQGKYQEYISRLTIPK